MVAKMCGVDKGRRGEGQKSKIREKNEQIRETEH